MLQFKDFKLHKLKTKMDPFLISGICSNSKGKEKDIIIKVVIKEKDLASLPSYIYVGLARCSLKDVLSYGATVCVSTFFIFSYSTKSISGEIKVRFYIK